MGAWAALLIAGVLEVIWASGLKLFSWQRPLLSLGVLAALAASFLLLAQAARQLPIGTAYAVWTGIGAVGAAIVGILFFREPATLTRMACIGLIIAGVIGLKVQSGA